MLLRRVIWALVVFVCLAAPMAVQAQESYLDVYVVRVKPEKTAEFNAIAKKIADANRRYNGDRWLAMSTIYGEPNTFQFVSARQEYADIEKANDAFLAALNKAYGKEAAEKMLHDWDACLAHSRAEFRRRRFDLSRKAPTDPTAYTKLIGESRLLRTTAVHIHPGHVPEFEALLKDMKEAGEKAENTQPVFVSQVIEGGKGTTFYVTTFRTGAAGFDKNPTMRDVLGEEGYKKFLQVNAEAVTDTESTLFRFSPDISSPPEEISAVAADFWNPKPGATASASTSKPKPATPKSTEAKPAPDKPKQ
jgi:quinol monooxygenase YgiN